jgi:hypothetical protein
MGLHLTAKEDFLYNIVLYLKNGEDTGREEPRTQAEVEDILNNKDKFKAIDVIQDELNYFGLSIDDFIWDSFGIWDKQLGQFKSDWKHFESEADLRETFEAFMIDLILDGSSEIHYSDFEKYDELWGLFGYEIRPITI